MDRGAWQARVHEVSNSWTRLKLQHTCTHTGWEREMSLFGKIPHCRTSLTLTHRSPFSHRRNLGPNGSHLGRSCASQGRGDVGKVKLFFSPTPIHPNSYFIFFSSSRVLQLLLWKPELPQRLSCFSVGNCLELAFSRCSGLPQEGWNWFTGYSRVHSWY